MDVCVSPEDFTVQSNTVKRLKKSIVDMNWTCSNCDCGVWKLALLTAGGEAT